MLDLSEHPENSKFYDKKNKKVTGKMKDENESVRLYDSERNQQKCCQVYKC